MQQNFLKRFYIYQKERFPFLAHGLLIGIFTFSAVSYSKLCRGVENTFDVPSLLATIFTTVTLFFLLRIFDEFKDKEEDAVHRKHLPVPRGLIKLEELKYVGIITFILQLLINLFFFPKMLLLYAAAVIYMLLMRFEFFIPEWLKAHQFWYVTSHMVIIPLIDIYASGTDWFLSGVNAPKGLLFFIIVSYLNGVVIEFGRKIKDPEHDEINTYTYMLGIKKATFIWIGTLFVTLLFSILASIYAGHSNIAIYVLIGLFLICSLPGWLFMNKQSAKNAKFVETAAGIWTMGMYLVLGGIPMLTKLIEL